MKVYGIIFAIFAILSVALASDAEPRDFSDPAHPGKCIINGLVLDPGYHADPNDKCVSYECEKNGMGTKFTSSPEGCEDIIYPNPQ